MEDNRDSRAPEARAENIRAIFDRTIRNKRMFLVLITYVLKVCQTHALTSELILRAPPVCGRWQAFASAEGASGVILSDSDRKS